MSHSDALLQRYLPAETFQPLVWLGLFFGFSALPVAVVYSTRSSPVFLALACLSLFADEVRRNRRLDRLRALAHGSWSKPMVLPLALLAALAMASAAWSAVPRHTLETAAQLAATLVLGISWVALVSRFRRAHALPFLAGGMAVALIVLPFELLHPAGIRSFFTDSLMAYEHNRAILQLSVLATLFAALAALSGYPLWRVWAAAVLAGLLLIMVPISDSQAAFVYWLAVALVAIAAGGAPLTTLAAVGLGTGILVIAFPWLFLFWGQGVASLFTAVFPAEFAGAAHVEQRVLIWTEFAHLVAERPWIGWGLQAERAIDLPGELRGTLPFSPHHPHSLALELWTGLGAAGALTAIAVLAGFMRLTARYTGLVAAWTATLFAGILAVWVLSHGAWETWWLAMLPLSLGTMLALDFYPSDGPAIAPS